MPLLTAPPAVPKNFGDGHAHLARDGQGKPTLKQYIVYLLAVAGAFVGGGAMGARWNKNAADGAANAATAEHVFHRAAFKQTVAGVQFTADAALAANDANNATLIVRRRNADGTAPVTVATYTSTTAGGSLAAFVAKSLTLTGANVDMAAGQVLTVEITKGGTGVVVPAGLLSVASAPSV